MKLTYELICSLEPPEGFRLFGLFNVQRWTEDGELEDQCVIIARLADWVLSVTRESVPPDLPDKVFVREVERAAPATRVRAALSP
jgi:hypothetical protein